MRRKFIKFKHGEDIVFMQPWGKLAVAKVNDRSKAEFNNLEDRTITLSGGVVVHTDQIYDK